MTKSQANVITSNATRQEVARDRAVGTVLSRFVYDKAGEGLVFASVTLADKVNKDESVDRIVRFGESRLPTSQLVEQFGDELVTDKEKMAVLFGEYVNGKYSAKPMLVSHGRDDKFRPTSKLLSVKFGKDKDIAKLMLQNGVWYKRVSLTPVMVVKTVVGKNVRWINCLTGAPVSNTSNAPSVEGGWQYFVFFKASPSEVRQKMCLMLDISDDMDRGERILESLTLGASKIFGAQEFNLAGAIKKFARLAQWAPYSKNVGKLRGCYVLKDAFAADDMDGLAFVRAGFVAEKVKAQTGVTLSEADLVGRALQDRPGFAKAMGLIVDDAGMLTILNKYGRDKFHVSGDASLPDYIADANSWKVDEIDMKQLFDYRVLSPLTRLEEPKYNIQVISKFVDDEGFLDLLFEDVKKFVSKQFWFVRQGEERQAGLTIESLADSAMTSRVLTAMAPDLAFRTPSVYYGAVKMAGDSILSAVESFKVPASKAAMCRMVPDVARMFGQSLLRKGEIFTRAFDAGVESVGIRMPSVYRFENTIEVNVDQATLLARINNMNISKGQKMFLHMVVRNLSETLILTPANNRRKLLLGGADYDSDTEERFYDERFVAAAKKQKQQAVNPQRKSKDDGKKHLLDREGRANAFTTMAFAPSVGTSCNNITRIREAETADEADQMAVMDVVFGAPGKGEYEVALDGEYVDEELPIAFVESLIALMKKADYTKEHVRAAMFHDMQVIQKCVVDRVIDSAKNADDVKDAFALNGKVAMRLFDRHEFCWVGDDGQFLETPVLKRVHTDGDNDVAIRINGAMSKLMTRLTTWVGKVVATYVAAFPGFSNGEENLLINASRDKRVFKSVRCLKNTYGDVMQLRKSLLGDVDPMSPEGRELTKWAKEYLNGISSMVEDLASEAKGMGGMGAVALAAAAADANGGFTGRSSFASAVAGSHLLETAISEGYVPMEEARTELFTDADLEEGMAVTLRRGLLEIDGELAGCTRRQINGEFVIRREGVRTFVSAKIKNLVAKMRKSSTGSVVLRMHGSEKPEFNQGEILGKLFGRKGGRKVVFASSLVDKAIGGGDWLVNEDGVKVRVSIEGVALAQQLHGEEIEIQNVQIGDINVFNSTKTIGMILGKKTGHIRMEVPGELLLDETEDWAMEDLEAPIDFGF